MNSYNVGTAAKCQTTFYSDNAKTTPADPTTVKFRLTSPAGVITEYTYPTDAQLVKSGTGVYYVNVTPTAGGVWTYTFRGTGAIVETPEEKFVAVATAFEN